MGLIELLSVCGPDVCLRWAGIASHLKTKTSSFRKVLFLFGIPDNREVQEPSDATCGIALSEGYVFDIFLVLSYWYHSQCARQHSNFKFYVLERPDDDFLKVETCSFV
jgi:hypothetical protein